MDLLTTSTHNQGSNYEWLAIQIDKRKGNMSKSKHREKKSATVEFKPQPKKHKDGSVTVQHVLPGSAGELPGARRAIKDSGT